MLPQAFYLIFCKIVKPLLVYFNNLRSILFLCTRLFWRRPLKHLYLRDCPLMMYSNIEASSVSFLHNFFAVRRLLLSWLTTIFDYVDCFESYVVGKSRKKLLGLVEGNWVVVKLDSILMSRGLFNKKSTEDDSRNAQWSPWACWRHLQSPPIKNIPDFTEKVGRIFLFVNKFSYSVSHLDKLRTNMFSFLDPLPVSCSYRPSACPRPKRIAISVKRWKNWEKWTNATWLLLLPTRR